MGGWEEGVPSVGRPVTTKKSRHDSYFTSRAVTYKFQLSNQREGRLGGRPQSGASLDVLKKTSRWSDMFVYKPLEASLLARPMVLLCPRAI